MQGSYHINFNPSEDMGVAFILGPGNNIWWPLMESWYPWVINIKQGHPQNMQMALSVEDMCEFS